MKLGDPKAKEIELRRQDRLKVLLSDPFLGYPSLEAAAADYRFNSQAEVLARLLNRENVFISGPAGSGKTTVINHFRELVEAEYNGRFEVALTASTGIAATLIQGSTIHSWAGLGISTEPFDPAKPELSMLRRRSSMRQADVLIIDEISMLPAYLFEKLNAVLKWARRNDKPFGGLQLVLTGDFLQLPPVNRDKELDTGFAITTPSWKEAEITCLYMDKTHRATDPQLKFLLAAIASGKAREMDKVAELIEARRGTPEDADPDKVYSTLYTTNANVEKFNNESLEKNPNPPVRIAVALREGTSGEQEKLIKQQGIPEVLTLKVGATVMLTSNINDTLANGSIGKVISFSEGIPQVRFNNGVTTFIDRIPYLKTEKTYEKDPRTGADVVLEKVLASVSQVPLKLAYAITVHKSQGQSFDGVICDLSKVFTPGLGYVALSRVRKLNDLLIVGWSPKALDLDPFSKKVSFYVKRQAREAREQFDRDREEYSGMLTDPLVRFIMWQEQDASRYKNEHGIPL